MTAEQHSAYATLVDAWKQRDDLRRAGAGIRELGQARLALEAARAEMAATLAA